MTHAIRIHAPGGPDVLRWEAIDVPAPQAGEVTVRHAAVGLNFIDVYFRTGLYPQSDMPFTPGFEASGVIEAVGPDVTHLAIGDRVAYGSGPIGAYAEARTMAAHHVVKLPDSIDDDTAAAMMLQGMTVEYLLNRTYPVKAGETILFHAAAGGVGLIACQWAKSLGATIIGTVGSPEKAALAKAHGCDHTILYRDENIVERVKDITDGVGVSVVYDSIGKDTFLQSLDCLKPCGLLASFGNASGPPPAVDLGLLAAKGSLYVTRPTLFTYAANQETLTEMAAALFAKVTDGSIHIEVNQRFALRDAAAAHQALEARQTTGSTVLTI